MTTNGAAKPQQVIFATPTLSHAVSIEYHQSMLVAALLLQQRGIGQGWHIVGGDQFIWKARNRLVTEILSEFPDATDIFMIDDDVGFPPSKVLEFINRPEPVLAGVYPKKNQHNEFPVELDLSNGRIVERDGLYRAVTIPAGFLRIKRDVLEQLAALAPKYAEPDNSGTWHERAYIFEAGVVNGKVLTEDAIFCQKWRDLGGEIWVDPAIAFSHRGAAVWHGSLAQMVDAHIERHPEVAPLEPVAADPADPAVKMVTPQAWHESHLAALKAEGRA